MPQRRPLSLDRLRSAPPPSGAAPAPEAVAPALPTDVIELIHRAGAVPNGLAVLERAPVECASVLLGARPRDVERARAVLASPAARRAALEVLTRARAEPIAPAQPPPGTPRNADELVLAAKRSATALEILATASPECAAVAFSVRPALVLEARALLAARGIALAGSEGP